MIDGIVNFLKPTGLTSSQAVGRVKRAFSRRDVGHMGTLDPFAAGVLPVAVGKATRLFEFYLGKKKTYRAVVRFGADSDTLDTAGRVVKIGRIPADDEIAAACASVIGTFKQIPPAYSAKSVDGVRAYDLARRGTIPILPAVTVTVTQCKYSPFTISGCAVIDVECSAGTYIRSLARDLGEKLGTKAILAALIRTRSGEWTIDRSVTETELFDSPDACLVGLDQLLSGIDRVDLDGSDYRFISNGVPVPIARHQTDPFTVYCRGELFGLGKCEDGKLTLSTYLHE